MLYMCIQPTHARARTQVLLKSGLGAGELDTIWRLSDADADGLLCLEEFVLAMHLTNARVKAGFVLPDTLPPDLVPKPSS